MGKAGKTRGLPDAAGRRAAGRLAARPFVARFLRDDRGATAIEYGLICALIFIAIITGVSAFGSRNTETYQVIIDEVDKVLPTTEDGA